jgi:hypothetical protein
MRTDDWENHVRAGKRWKLAVIIALLAIIGSLALGVGAAGFSDGMVCAVPATIPQAAAPDSYSAQTLTTNWDWERQGLRADLF